MSAINWSKGFLRGYFAVWLVWVSFGFLSEYREILTDFGIKRWSIEDVAEQMYLRHEQLGCSDPSVASKLPIDCSKEFPRLVVSPESVKGKSGAFILVGIVAPAILLMLLILFWYLGRWVIKGFRS